MAIHFVFYPMFQLNMQFQSPLRIVSLSALLDRASELLTSLFRGETAAVSYQPFVLLKFPLDVGNGVGEGAEILAS